MSKGMTRRGVGPLIGITSGAYFLLALVINWACYSSFVVKGIPYFCLAVIGCVLTGLGVPTLILTARAVRRAFRRRKLLTQGPYAICRHPVYAVSLVCICGMVMFFRSWLMFTVPVAA